MALIFYYLGFMAAGDVAAYLLGSAVEYEWGSQVSFNCLSGSVFSILVDRLDIGCVDNEAEVGRAGCLLSSAPQIRRGRQVRCGAIP